MAGRGSLYFQHRMHGREAASSIEDLACRLDQAMGIVVRMMEAEDEQTESHPDWRAVGVRGMTFRLGCPWCCYASSLSTPSPHRIGPDGRPGWDRLMEYARAGDTLVVTELSRMTRSLLNLLETAKVLEERQIDLVSLREKIDTGTAAGRVWLQRRRTHSCVALSSAPVQISLRQCSVMEKNVLLKKLI